jgi:elongation factor Ts
MSVEHAILTKETLRGMKKFRKCKNLEVNCMAVTAAMIKTLREMTNAGISDCKQALVSADGDFDRAVEILREKGLAAAAKKAGRIASEGLVTAVVSEDGKAGVLLEVNSETDFVAKNSDFKSYVASIARQALATATEAVEDFLEEKWHLDENVTVKDVLVQKIATIGERLDIRRFSKFKKEGEGLLSSYIHGGGRVAVMLDLEAPSVTPEVEEAAKNVCMQIAAMSPLFVSREDIPQDYVEKEAEIAKQQTLTEERERAEKDPGSYKPKPEQVLEKIIKNRLEKNLSDISLLSQGYVRDSELPEAETKGKKTYTVADYLKYVGNQEVGTALKVKSFVRYETGEGLAKKDENFAEEVSKAIMS